MVGLGRDCEGRGNKGSKQRWLRWSEWLKIFHKLQKHFSNRNQREHVWRFWNPLSTPYLSSSDHIGAIINFYLEVDLVVGLNLILQVDFIEKCLVDWVKHFLQWTFDLYFQVLGLKVSKFISSSGMLGHKQNLSFVELQWWDQRFEALCN